MMRLIKGVNGERYLTLAHENFLGNETNIVPAAASYLGAKL
jgi:hypothetical protein